ncbi:MAG TPA: FAD-dependent oxidoreductase [Candidatus Coprenecus pullicola]|nr:FAD-dependent oxidoreductase [Candidatus Coprenecus pullicola]
MYNITSHPILPVPPGESVSFDFEGRTITGQKGQTVAAALHKAGCPVHSLSLEHRKRTMECGIGKCGACEMLVDGRIRRICVTKVDGVREVSRLSADSGFKGMLVAERDGREEEREVYRTTVAIIGAGPAGLAVREELLKEGVDCLVIDSNSEIGGQFLMQTHQFFFFEKEKRFGGMRGFDIARTLAGDSHEGIMLDSVVWDILEGKRLAVKNIVQDKVFYVDADELVIATGAVPFMPAFKNDDVPGVYTAAVVQRMMNTQFTLLGKNILTVGAGNIGYLTSYQAMQAGANVRMIIEGMPREGGFPVQANRVRRLGIPILTSHVLVEAVPNADCTGITGAIIAECENFKPIPGTERLIDGIDCINICTGLMPDNQLFVKGNAIYGRSCHGVGDAVRIGEGTSAVLRGRQCAYEILQNLGRRFNYDNYLQVSKEYIDSQQHPVRILQEPAMPTAERAAAAPFVIMDCLYGFACNPCSFSCKQGAITKSSTSTTPKIDYDKCIGCMQCVYQCPGLAIFGYDTRAGKLFLPIEYDAKEGSEVFLVDDNGRKVGEGVIEKILVKPNKTNVARVKVARIYDGGVLTDARGFIVKEKYPEPVEMKPAPAADGKTYICHCEDITVERMLELIGDRKSISADELKHISRMGMGPCRGKRCLSRAKSALRSYGIEVTGDLTPRAPMANLVEFGDVINIPGSEKIILPAGSVPDGGKVGALVAGGGMAGSAVFRYLAEAGFAPVLVNKDRGSSWRNIAGGRPAFSLPALADIANHNLEIFRDLQQHTDIDFRLIRYVNFAHDEATYRSLDAARAWSKAYMVDPKDFQKEISPYMNPALNLYVAAQVTEDCWQATPGKTVNAVRLIGRSHGGRILEETELVDVRRTGGEYEVLVRDSSRRYTKFRTEVFINALGAGAEKFAHMLGIETGLYPVRHQAFITKRLPLLGKDGATLDMLIDRRHYKGFSAVYGQQLADTGQIIGCASPATDPAEAGKDLKVNTQAFLEISSEVFSEWIPALRNVGIQATWAGYYVEPRYIVDPSLGLFIGMRGHGFMLSQYIGKLYVDALLGRQVPEYFKDMALGGSGLSEQAFK